MYMQSNYDLHVSHNNVECDWNFTDEDFENESLNLLISYKYSKYLWCFSFDLIEMLSGR